MLQRVGGAARPRWRPAVGAGCWPRAPSRARSCASTCRRSGRARSSRRRLPASPAWWSRPAPCWCSTGPRPSAPPTPRGCAVHGLRAGRARPAGVAGAAATGRVIGRLRPSRRDAGDIETGLAAVSALAPFATGAGVVVVRHYILAIEAAEGAAGHARARGGAAAVGPALAQGRACWCAAPRTRARRRACSRRFSPRRRRRSCAGIAVTGAGRRARRPTRRRRGSPTTMGLFLVLCEVS